MAKKKVDITRWLWIGGVPASLGAIGFIAVSLTTYIKLPDRVASAEEKVESIEDYIKEQRIQNDIMQKIVTDKEEVIYSPDGKKYWNDKKQEWRPIKELDQ